MKAISRFFASRIHRWGNRLCCISICESVTRDAADRGSEWRSASSHVVCSGEGRDITGDKTVWSVVQEFRVLHTASSCCFDRLINRPQLMSVGRT